MHELYMFSQLLLLALATLAVVICLTFVYRDFDKDIDKDFDKADGETTENTAGGETSSRRLKRKSARDKSPVSRRAVTELAEGAISACTL
jgi:hypothetical protein